MCAPYAPKRKAVGSNPAGEAKAKDPRMGVFCFTLHRMGFERVRE